MEANEKTRLMLLRQERKMRAKQPTAWTKTKYRQRIKKKR
jgi:uncharacterized protein YifE (UPF0438 family)